MKIFSFVLAGLSSLSAFCLKAESSLQAVMGISKQSLIIFYIGVMALSALGFILMRRSQGTRVPLYFYMIHFAIVCWSGLIYLNILFNTPLRDYAWYADWVISTPLIVLALGLSAMYYLQEKRWDLIWAVMGFQAVTIITGVLAQLSYSQNALLTFFILGNVAMLGVFYMIWGPLMTIARQSGYELYAKYRLLASYLVIFWIAYPAIWILGTPGFGLISDYATTLSFVILPILCKSGFGFLDLYLLGQLQHKNTAQA
ncbi:hypothetical protein Noda2021_11320 [Candidatus Dependentiae bacterium Noda2021]|nr:hypothetical protein Noda2021_11320 [Candidatus Dependentiae bacterium Noda2021]